MGLLILSIILNCTLVIGVYLIDKHTPFKKWSYIKKQILIGVLFVMIAGWLIYSCIPTYDATQTIDNVNNIENSDITNGE
jgi:uncharacterized membrane protein YjfL (UPF0719 family)